MVRVLATRPQAQNSPWAQKLSQKGFDVVECPLLEIRPLVGDKQRDVINIVLELDRFQKIIFVSQNAVAHGFDCIQQYWPQFPLRVECFAVGKKTSNQMRERLEECSCFTYTPPEHDVMTSEDLLQLPNLHSVEHDDIVIFRGVGGRDLIKQTLEERGAKIRYGELYERVCPASAEEQLRQAELSDEDVIPVFSGESLTNLDDLLSVGVAGSAEPILVLPGERVADMAKDLGYERFIVAKNASEPEMMKALGTLLARHIH